jgi:hypothetical protein
MSFAFGGRELRGAVLSMLETHIVMSSLIFRRVLILMFRLSFTLVLLLALSHVLCLALSHVLCLALLLVLCLSSLMDPTIAHMVLVHEENRFEPRRLGYGPRPHRGDRLPCRPDFPAEGSFPQLESRHLDGPRFLRRGSRPTRSSGEVQRTMKTSSGRMVKCWIPKIYRTNPSTESSTFSHPM